MIFSCGETVDAQVERLAKGLEALEEWHDWFAFKPVNVGEKDGHYICAWLQTVQRKGTRRSIWSSKDMRTLDGWFSWEYRLKPSTK